MQDLVSGLCFRHAALARKTSETLSDSVDLTAELLFVGSTVIETAESINIVLTNLVEVVAKGRISSRRAAVLSYALSLLLRSVVAMDLHNANTPPNIVWDAPRPIRDPIPFPANAPAEANPKPADSPATGEEPSFQEKFDAAERYSRLRT
ncbi:MAG: hypothetical protein ACRD51_15905 [Candidatus Acidiferrum sp.]